MNVSQGIVNAGISVTFTMDAIFQNLLNADFGFEKRTYQGNF